MTVAQGLAPLAQVLAPSTPPFAQFSRGLAPLAPLGTPRANSRNLRVLYEFARFALLVNYSRLCERPRFRETDPNLATVIDAYAKEKGFAIVLDISSPQSPVLVGQANRVFILINNDSLNGLLSQKQVVVQ